MSSTIRARWFAACLVAVALALLGGRLTAASRTHFEGTIGPGSTYVIDVPPLWNGDLVLYAHGIVQADQPLLPASELEGYPALRDGLLAQGYAVAASSYSSNGWALADAVQRTHQLGKIFGAKVSPPRRTFLMGHSLGALAVTKLAETYPTQYAGALPMCGPLGGMVAELKYAGDVRVLFDHFFPGVIPGTPFDVPPGTDFTPPSASTPPSPLFLAVYTQLQQHPLEAAEWMSAAQLPGATMAEIGNSALYALGFDIRYTNDLVERANGKIPYDNTQSVYQVNVPGQPASVNALLGAALNATVARYSAAPAAVNYYERNYEPSGDLAIPLLTLHTVSDPGIPIWHEDLYEQKVAAAGRSAFLRQYAVPGWGHCAIPEQAIMAGFAELVQWAGSGK
jgi:pimeloyl-ACP methyl ester carboxylesterase